jgi:hypothetical protein
MQGQRTRGCLRASPTALRSTSITNPTSPPSSVTPTVLLVKVGPSVLEFHAKLVAAVAPFTESGGTDAAFVKDPGEEISPTIIKWVEAFVPNQIGEGNYLPHLTVGVATFDDLKVIEAEPFDAFPVHPVSVAVPPRQQRHRPQTAQSLASSELKIRTVSSPGARIGRPDCAPAVTVGRARRF